MAGTFFIAVHDRAINSEIVDCCVNRKWIRNLHNGALHGTDDNTGDSADDHVGVSSYRDARCSDK